MGLLLTYEEIIGTKVDYVLRARDDEHYLADLHFRHSVDALADKYDVLSNDCGSFAGLNDHTYFFKRNSPAFEAVRLGQLTHAYLAKTPPPFAMQNPEYLLLQAMVAQGAKIALVAPCHFSAVAVRNSTDVGLCIDWSTWFANIDASMDPYCRRYPNRVMPGRLATCGTTKDNHHGQIVAPPVLPRCAEPIKQELSNVQIGDRNRNDWQMARKKISSALTRQPKSKPQPHWQ